MDRSHVDKTDAWDRKQVEASEPFRIIAKECKQDLIGHEMEIRIMSEELANRILKALNQEGFIVIPKPAQL